MNHSHSSLSGQSDEKIRVRFAPSPTGYLHVGGARTVLFNWLFAKKMKGQFILRIEDTDQERSTRQHEAMQIEDLKWLEFQWDEGPDCGGPHAPYRQSERLEIYARYAQELLDSDRAYPCFCSEEVLTQKREAAMKLGNVPQYDGACRKISKEEAARRKAAGEKPTVRFKAPVQDYKLQDLVRGEVVFQANMVGDFIILRNDGMPVYNFCCVIDDHLMNITHVIRAEEHLSNTVRQMMLYETFGWALPQFVHCSLILGADRSKLSKRHGATSIHQYAEEGYLKEALINFMLLLGWSPPEELQLRMQAKHGNPEIIDLEEMIENFSLDRFNKAPSVFDTTKLKWMNSQYIRSYPLEALTQKIIPYLQKEGFPSQVDQKWLEQAVDSIRGHLETLAQAPQYLGIYFDEKLVWEKDALEVKGWESYGAVVQAFADAIQVRSAQLQSAGWSDALFSEIQNDVKAKSGAKGKQLFMPMRVAVTGQTHGPELKIVLPLLGIERTLKRIKNSFSVAS